MDDRIYSGQRRCNRLLIIYVPEKLLNAAGTQFLAMMSTEGPHSIPERLEVTRNWEAQRSTRARNQYCHVLTDLLSLRGLIELKAPFAEISPSALNKIFRIDPVFVGGTLPKVCDSTAGKVRRPHILLHLPA